MSDDLLDHDPLYRRLEAELAAPFADSQISWRVGSTTQDKTKGMALAYIDARDVMGRLDEVCGVNGWQDRYDNAGNGKTCCAIGIRIDGEWIWKSDGAGDTDFEADKGAFSDSFKRAAVRWGVGRYLYGIPSKWVEIEARGKSFVISQDEVKKLEALHREYSEHKGIATPAERATLSVLLTLVRDTVRTAQQRDAFIEKHKGTLGQLRAEPKKMVWEALQHAT
jgi:hypothetical protein